MFEDIAINKKLDGQIDPTPLHALGKIRVKLP